MLLVTSDVIERLGLNTSKYFSITVCLPLFPPIALRVGLGICGAAYAALSISVKGHINVFEMPKKAKPFCRRSSVFGPSPIPRVGGSMT